MWNGELDHKNTDFATHMVVVRGISLVRPIICLRDSALIWYSAFAFNRKEGIYVVHYLLEEFVVAVIEGVRHIFNVIGCT